MNVCIPIGVERQKPTFIKSQKTDDLENGRTWETCAIKII